METGEKPSGKDFAEQLGWSTGLGLVKGAGQTECLLI